MGTLQELTRRAWPVYVEVGKNTVGFGACVALAPCAAYGSNTPTDTEAGMETGVVILLTTWADWPCPVVDVPVEVVSEDDAVFLELLEATFGSKVCVPVAVEEREEVVCVRLESHPYIIDCMRRMGCNGNW